MADLMTGVYTYEELANKYGNFHVPALRLYVDGKEVPQEVSLNVMSAEISLSLTSASMAVIRMDGGYDRKKRSFDDNIKNRFKLGTIVEIGIGYGSEIKKVLKGYVASMGIEFQDSPSLTLTIMDVRRLMMQSGIHIRCHDVKNYSDAVKEILNEYSKFCKAEIDPTNDKLDRKVSQNSTDYEFIARRMASNGRAGREFFVLADTAYFRKPRKEKRSIMKLEYGRELLQFHMESSYTNLAIEISGGNVTELKNINARAIAKSKEPQVNINYETPVSYILDPEADNQNKAKIRAEALADAEVRAGQRARGVCIGLPEIVPGRFIRIVKLEELVNKKYYITSVRHNFDKNFFKTAFEIGGWD